LLLNQIFKKKHRTTGKLLISPVWRPEDCGAVVENYAERGKKERMLKQIRKYILKAWKALGVS